MAARGDITQHANPKFLWGTPQTLSYNPTKFQPICSAGPFLAKIPILSGHPIYDVTNSAGFRLKLLKPQLSAS